MSQRIPCDPACPSLETFESNQAQNWGCLPCQFEIKEMLKNKEVWMCHSNPSKPCVATGLDEIPEGFTPREDY